MGEYLLKKIFRYVNNYNLGIIIKRHLSQKQVSFNIIS